MPFASAHDLYDRLMQYGKTGDMLVGREDDPLAPLLPFDMVSGRFCQVWRYILQTEIMGRGLDGIVVGLEGGMVAKVNKLHPSALKQCSTEACRRSMEAESEERFKKEVDYLLKHQDWPFVVPVLPVVYVECENSQRLGYLMPELKSADQFDWPNELMVAQVFRQLLSILSFFRKSKVVYGDFKPQNLLLQELPGGVFEVKLNDFGFVGTVGGEFQGGTDEYLPWVYQSRLKYVRLDYTLDTYAVRRILVDMLGCDTVCIEVGSEEVRIQGLAGGIASLSYGCCEKRCGASRGAQEPAKGWILRDMWPHDTVLLEAGSGVVMVLHLKWRPGPMEGPELEGLQLNALEPNERGMMLEVCCLTGSRNRAILDSKF